MSTPEWINESRLPVQLGLNRDELRGLRKKMLLPSVDWRLKKNRVQISPGGLVKLQAHLKVSPPRQVDVQASGLEPGSPVVASEKKTAQVNAGERIVQLHVYRTFPKNRHIIEGYRPGTDPAQQKNVVRIKVKDSTRFTRYDNTGKPLLVPCTWIQADFYEHAGPLPRRKGRL